MLTAHNERTHATPLSHQAQAHCKFNCARMNNHTHTHRLIRRLTPRGRPKMYFGLRFLACANLFRRSPVSLAVELDGAHNTHLNIKFYALRDAMMP